jgi:membrane-bound inhibitor of C-type lysozyme
MKTTMLTLAVAGFALSGLVPVGAADAAKKPIKAKYYCNKGQSLKVVFQGSWATVTPKGGKTVTLTQARTADGFLYAKGKYSLRGRGSKATWTAGHAKPLKCTS